MMKPALRSNKSGFGGQIEADLPVILPQIYQSNSGGLGNKMVLHVLVSIVIPPGSG
jgi:hypothetical protein